MQYRVRRIICGACAEKSEEQHEAGSDSILEALVDEYIECFAARDENQDAADWGGFGSAFIQLKTERYDLEGIRKMDHTGWFDMGIPQGLGRRLSSSVRAFIRETR